MKTRATQGTLCAEQRIVSEIHKTYGIRIRRLKVAHLVLMVCLSVLAVALVSACLHAPQGRDMSGSGSRSATLSVINNITERL